MIHLVDDGDAGNFVFLNLAEGLLKIDQQTLKSSTCPDGSFLVNGNDAFHAKTDILDVVIGDGKEMHVGGEGVDDVRLRKDSNQISAQCEGRKSAKAN